MISALAMVFLTSCSVGSTTRSGMKTLYKTAVDERTVRQIMDIAREVTGNPPVPYILKKGDDRFCTIADNFRIATELQAHLVATGTGRSWDAMIDTISSMA